MFPAVPEEIVNKIKSCKCAIVCGHVKPDGDCSNSAMAVSRLLARLGKKCINVNDGPFALSETKEYEKIIAKTVPHIYREPGALGIVVDCSTLDRLGDMAVYYKNIDTVVIDHHSSGIPFGNARYIVPDSPSTTLLVWQLFKALGVKPNAEDSALIFRGFSTDSGYFRFLREKSGDCFRIVAEIVDSGVNPAHEYSQLFNRNPYQDIKYMAALLSRSERVFQGRLYISHQEETDSKEFGINITPSDNLYRQLLGTEGTEIVLFFKLSETKQDSIEVGIRVSEGSTFDAGAFASTFGGGGHVKAAGVTIKGNYESVRKIILDRIYQYLPQTCSSLNYENIIDSHFHTSYINDSASCGKYLIKELLSKGFAGGIDIGTRYNDLGARYELLNEFPQIKLSAAMGPWECGKSETSTLIEEGFEDIVFKSQEEIDREFVILTENIKKYNPLFIGECGLDYYWQYGTREKQIRLFEDHMELAKALNKAVIIHNRMADEDTTSIIKKYSIPKGGIVHCFSGDKNLMYTALDNEYYISFAGNITYKKNNELREALKLVPIDRLLLETDAPYLAPVPCRGQSNSMAFIPHTYSCVSEILGIDERELALTVSNNFSNLCNL